MTQKPLSIIIVTWNTQEKTDECISSIFRYLPSIFEIILVDNHSSDTTVSFFKNKYQDKIKIVENQDNLGYAKACNAGTKIASGEFLLFLNSDMVFLDDSLTKMLAYLQANPQIALIGPTFLNPDLSPQASVFPPQTPISAFLEFWLKKPTYSKYTPGGNVPTPVFAISGGAILVSKNTFIQLGQWNEKYPFYFEDLDLCRQTHRLGFQVFFYPQTKIIHYHGASGHTLADSQNQWRRLIPGSILYHGLLMHHFINFIIWSGQKFHSLFKTKAS